MTKAEYEAQIGADIAALQAMAQRYFLATDGTYEAVSVPLLNVEISLRQRLDALKRPIDV